MIGGWLARRRRRKARWALKHSDAARRWTDGMEAGRRFVEEGLSARERRG